MPARIGETLTNGATIVDIYHVGVTGSFGAVLAVRYHDVHPYVVWSFRRVGDTVDTYHTFHGEYTDDLSEALASFDARIEQEERA